MGKIDDRVLQSISNCCSHCVLSDSDDSHQAYVIRKCIDANTKLVGALCDRELTLESVTKVLRDSYAAWWLMRYFNLGLEYCDYYPWELTKDEENYIDHILKSDDNAKLKAAKVCILISDKCKRDCYRETIPLFMIGNLITLHYDDRLTVSLSDADIWSLEELDSTKAVEYFSENCFKKISVPTDLRMFRGSIKTAVRYGEVSAIAVDAESYEHPTEHPILYVGIEEVTNKRAFMASIPVELRNNCIINFDSPEVVDRMDNLIVQQGKWVWGK